MSDTEAVVADPMAAPVAPVVAQEPVVVQVVAITDADLAKLKAKKGTAPRYMISWRLLDALIVRLEAAEHRLAEIEANE